MLLISGPVIDARFIFGSANQAYHDMSTHNIEDGTGGLDASIRFETGRPEV